LAAKSGWSIHRTPNLTSNRDFHGYSVSRFVGSHSFRQEKPPEFLALVFSRHFARPFFLRDVFHRDFSRVLPAPEFFAGTAGPVFDSGLCRQSLQHHPQLDYFSRGFSRGLAHSQKTAVGAFGLGLACTFGHSHSLLQLFSHAVFVADIWHKNRRLALGQPLDFHTQCRLPCPFVFVVFYKKKDRI